MGRRTGRGQPRATCPGNRGALMGGRQWLPRLVGARAEEALCGSEGARGAGMRPGQRHVLTSCWASCDVVLVWLSGKKGQSRLP